jgi:GNAT superfamily N-acetyltransferase
MVTIHDVDTERWDDLCELFGPSGAYSGCWCMWWRVSGQEFGANGNAGNRAALDALVRQGRPLGLLAYQNGVPVGWASVAPREDFPRIGRSRALKPQDDQDGVWAVPCFFIHKGHRGEGIATALLDRAVRHARMRKAKALEGYPVDNGDERRPNADLFTGTVGLFEKAGFAVVSRPPTGRRVVMRKQL